MFMLSLYKYLYWPCSAIHTVSVQISILFNYQIFILNIVLMFRYQYCLCSDINIVSVQLSILSMFRYKHCLCSEPVCHRTWHLAHHRWCSKAQDSHEVIPSLFCKYSQQTRVIYIEGNDYHNRWYMGINLSYDGG